MNLFGFSVLLMLWGYSRAQGETCDYRKIENGRYYWASYDRYPNYYFPMSNGKQVSYICNDGFATTSGSAYGEMQCTSNGWSPAPKCLLTGGRCGPAPPIANGDVVGAYQQSHNSGTSVTYKCQYYHTMEGSAVITCQNGAWTALPVCLEPCTTNSEEMAANKLQLRFLNQSKAYIKHGDSIEFTCTVGYRKVETMEYRVQCKRGKLTYPKCISPDE